MEPRHVATTLPLVTDRYRSKVVSYALLAPAIYAGFDLLKAQIVAPNVLGGRLTLSSVIVFLSVGFWGWTWGVPGAPLAVPAMEKLGISYEILSGDWPPSETAVSLGTLHSASMGVGRLPCPGSVDCNRHDSAPRRLRGISCYTEAEKRRPAPHRLSKSKCCPFSDCKPLGLWETTSIVG